MNKPSDFTHPSIQLSAHDPSWAHEFTIIAQTLHTLLDSLPIVTIEHVGSTSIQDLIAKPILDIDIEIHSADFPAVRECLVDAGYIFRPSPESHLAGRYLFWQPGTALTYGHPADPKARKWNTHVVFQGGIGVRNHRDLKRVLMEDAVLRNEYGQTKLYLVERDDVYMPAYTAGKNFIIEKILRKAGGWTDHELAVVAKRVGNEEGECNVGDWCCEDSTWFEEDDREWGRWRNRLLRGWAMIRGGLGRLGCK